MSERVRITDVSARDGLQNEAGIVPATEKTRLVRALLGSGVDEVEATSFVSARWVPQLGDAEEVLGAIAGTRAAAGAPAISALVPNEKGFERALAFHERLRDAGYPGGLKIAVFTAASETFSRRNTNASIAETIERFRAFVGTAAGAGMSVRGYVSCAVACPFEGAIEPDAVRAVADDLLSLLPAIEIDLGDTIGVAHPADIERLLAVFSGSERAAMTLHLHDTFGRAAACVRTALGMGVRSFDGSVAGLGGCPYAGTKERPAPGNFATESLTQTVREAGFDTGVDEGRLAAAAALAREIVGCARSAELKDGGTR